jgi:hypothetical protein
VNAVPVNLHRSAFRYEVRAVWMLITFCQSQPAEQYDRKPMLARAPDEWGVYEVGGGNVQDYPERASAQIHTDQLNGVCI